VAPPDVGKAKACFNASWSNRSRPQALNDFEQRTNSMETTFNGFGMSLGNLSLLSAGQTPKISMAAKGRLEWLGKEPLDSETATLGPI
jgi:hypothetical protein